MRVIFLDICVDLNMLHCWLCDISITFCASLFLSLFWKINFIIFMTLKKKCRDVNRFHKFKNKKIKKKSLLAIIFFFYSVAQIGRRGMQ